jgi:hypothetical protein
MLLMVGYLCALRITYVAFIAPYFGYMNYKYLPPGIAFEAVFWAGALVPATWMPLVVERPSKLLLWFLYAFVYVPVMLVPMLGLSSSVGQKLMLAGSFIVGFHIVALSQLLPLVQFPRINYAPSLFWLGIAGFAALLYALVISSFGLRLTLPTLAEVYSTRAEYRATLKESSVLVAYAVPWLAKVINPLAIIRGLTRREPLTLAAGLGGQMLLFAITGMKSIFLSGLLLALLLVPLRNNGRSFGLWVAGGGAALVAVGAIIDGFLPYPLFSGLLTRRVILTPGLLTGLFFDFYSTHQPVLLSLSFLRSLIEPQSALPPARMIGAVFFGSDVMSANANIWADAFANFRYFGLFGVSVVLLFVFWLLDSLAVGQSRNEATLLLALPALAFCNTSLPTVLLTHGVLLAMLLLYLRPREAMEPVPTRSLQTV